MPFSDTGRPRFGGPKTTVTSTQLETVTETPSSSLTTTTNSPTSISSPSDSNTSTTSITSSSSSSSSGPRILSLGPIIGGVVAALTIILLFIFLLLKRRSSQRESRLHAPMTLQVVPRGPSLDTRENCGRYDCGSRSPIASRLSSAPTTLTSDYSPQRPRSAPSANVPKLRGRLSTRTNYTAPLSAQDEEIQLECISNPNPEVPLNLPSSSSHNLSSTYYGATREEIPPMPTYIPNQDPNKIHHEMDFTNGSEHSDYSILDSPPAYSRITDTNTSQLPS